MTQPQSSDYPIDLPFESDNRDLITTWLWLHNTQSGMRIEVDPWDLVKNVIENANLPTHMQVGMKATIDEVRDEIEQYQSTETNNDNY